MIDGFHGEFDFLSNFYPCLIEYDGISYPSVEHAYQAAKTLDKNTRITISKLPTPGKAKRAGQKLDLRDGWDEIKLGIMRELLELKFSLPFLREKLIATGQEALIEGNDWNDTYWGVCNGKGNNYLGRLLMDIRDDLLE